MVNFPKQIGLLYEDTMVELGEAVAYQVYCETRVTLNKLCIGVHPTAVATHLGKSVNISIRHVFTEVGGSLTHLVIGCDQINALQDPIAITASDEIKKLFNAVQLGHRLLTFLETTNIS